MKKLVFMTVLLLMLLTASCSDVKHWKERGSKGERQESLSEEEKIDWSSFSETTTNEDLPESHEEAAVKAPSSTSSPSRRYYDDDDDDNLRGFDPRSEDDMDDNGMSRYMNEYDDEGWD
ncbi:MAG: hypothetical protein IJ196_03945 [Prevotella sp.]|nr:hypothetical protein [Prevotella sp.]